ncbi:acyl-CoA carboxylase subunit beta [Alcaligenaceae bacterium]|nr:acyl-CoA carboxylase subunit beta [Alcaligenaceae bacterium]
MQKIPSNCNQSDSVFLRNRECLIRLIEQCHSLELRAVEQSAKAAARFHANGKLLPRERLAQLLDPGQAFLELMTLAGYCGHEDPDPETSIPGSAIIAGIGSIAGALCMVVISDAGISAGAMQSMTAAKVMRCQEIALAHRLPFVQLVESAGGNLKKYRVERFLNGGGMFYNLAKLSAGGVPVVSLIHGSSAAGGAYLPGLSDYVVMVRNQARAYLAGPSLLQAATGEVATEEELGGADMHASVSGLADYVADNDTEAIEQVRLIVSSLDWPAPLPHDTWLPPAHEIEDILGLIPADARTPVDMREIVARIVDGSMFHEFKSTYGVPTVCGYAAIHGMKLGIITNNGPLDPQGSTKAAQFIQLCAQLNRPILFLQNITGFIVGKAHEEAGMIKHGAKLIQALSNASVPRITILCGASYGAGNYGMCGHAFKPDFLFSWPNAKTAVMGGEQAARTMQMVAEVGARRSGKVLDQAVLETEKNAIVENFESQMSAIYTSSRLLDDGVIDPRDTREVLAHVLGVVRNGKARPVSEIQFGVARF